MTARQFFQAEQREWGKQDNGEDKEWDKYGDKRFDGNEEGDEDKVGLGENEDKLR